MKEVEKMLIKKKIDIDQIEIPEELETRLNEALKDSSPAKPKKRNWKTTVAAACIAVLLIGYNLDALAYYGKKLLGYDQIMNGTLQQLNELGKGQPIGKSYTFKNGVTVILDGIMVDENQLLAFYTVKNPKGEANNSIGSFMSIKGFIKEYNAQSGQGQINDEDTEIKWILSFEKPSIFEKTLRFTFESTEDNIREVGQISFKIDPNKAMGYTMKQKINKTFKVNETKVHLESIVASPTKTVLYGSIQNIVELVKDQVLGERLRPNNINIKLFANGQEITNQGSGMSTGTKGIRFDKEYDVLPKNLKSVQIQIESLSVDRDVNKKVDIKKGANKQEVKALEQNIVINKISESKGSTYVTITTAEDIVLTKVGLLVDGERIGLKETINSDLEKLIDGRIMHTRTLHFPAIGDTYQLSIEKMTYTQPYNKTIDIPIN